MKQPDPKNKVKRMPDIVKPELPCRQDHTCVGIENGRKNGLIRHFDKKTANSIAFPPPVPYISYD
jgi:hypothetical protein